MKLETAIGTAMMAFVGVALVIILAGAIGPKTIESQPQPAAGQPDTAPAPPAVVATRPPLDVTPSAGLPQDVQTRDAKRLSDLQAIADALEAYRERRNTYPNTGGRVQTGCVFQNLDKLCDVRDAVGPARLSDPRGNPNAFGYWYVSDGTSFTVMASMEGESTGSDPCPQSVSSVRAQNLFCLNSGAASRN